MSMTLLYRQPQLLDRNQHRGKRVRRVPSLQASAPLNACFLTSGEFAEAAKEYVIAFVGETNAQGGAVAEVSPVVLLGLRDKQNLFVDASGTWDAHYVPAFLRRYPFAYANTADGNSGVMIDAAFEGFAPGAAPDDGELLVQDDGEPAPYLQEVIRFLDAFEQEAQRTRALCARIVELGLLKPVQIDVKLPDGSSFNAGGLQMIDEAKLKALPQAAAMELIGNGALGLLYAQLVSAGNVQRLTDRLMRREQPQAAAPAA